MLFPSFFVDRSRLDSLLQSMEDACHGMPFIWAREVSGMGKSGHIRPGRRDGYLAVTALLSASFHSLTCRERRLVVVADSCCQVQADLSSNGCPRTVEQRREDAIVEIEVLLTRRQLCEWLWCADF